MCAKNACALTAKTVGNAIRTVFSWFTCLGLWKRLRSRRNEVTMNPLNQLMNAAQSQTNSFGPGGVSNSQAYGGLLGGGGGGYPSPSTSYHPNNHPNNFPVAFIPMEPEGRTTITIDEVSNGHIIKIGSLTRLAPFSDSLIEHIGAAFTHAKMENKDAK